MSHIRQAFPIEFDRYAIHLKNLDSESRHLRFFSNLPDAAIDQFVSKITDDVLLIIEDGFEWVAVAHIAFGADVPEVAFSVLADYRNRGYASALMDRVVQKLKALGHVKAKMLCLQSNRAIQQVCRKMNVKIERIDGEVVATLNFDKAILLDVYVNMIHTMRDVIESIATYTLDEQQSKLREFRKSFNIE